VANLRGDDARAAKAMSGSATTAHGNHGERGQERDCPLEDALCVADCVLHAVLLHAVSDDMLGECAMLSDVMFT